MEQEAIQNEDDEEDGPDQFLLWEFTNVEYEEYQGRGAMGVDLPHPPNHTAFVWVTSKGPLASSAPSQDRRRPQPRLFAPPSPGIEAGPKWLLANP